MKQLSEMSLEELWELFPIILVPHDPKWENYADEEIELLSNNLGSQVHSIHHIGSTAINGIWAKPIIDLIVEAETTDDFEAIEKAIVQLGYIRMSKSHARISFNKGYTPYGFADKVFHVHLRQKGDTDEILFRDYLNGHPSIAKEYEKLKLSLWKEFEHNRDAYTAAKSSFVTHYTDLAAINKKAP